MKNFFKSLTFRHYFMVLGTIIALCVLFGTSPGAGLIQLAFGADIVSKLSSLPSMVFGVTILFIGTKALYDYIDMGRVVDKAMETSQGAGLVFIGVAISRIAVAIIVMGMISTFM